MTHIRPHIPLRAGAAVAVVAGLLLGTAACSAEEPAAPVAKAPAGGASPKPAETPAATPAPPAELPGLGPRTRATIGAEVQQVVLVTGEGKDSNRSRVRLYERHPDLGWRPAADEWAGRNGHKGWAERHVRGDLRTPVGTYRLTDAGGRLANPGTALPYDRNRGILYTARGTNFENKPKAGALDYIVAINYNRITGRPPYDFSRPMGAARGGGIWFHVSHHGGTEGCVGLPRGQMKELLRKLKPGAKPVTVMGPAESLAR
ncbi:L,D-transpeptidase family protein [Streptomyces sp. NPDC048057]|uniref:L,D-transpeptidase family protein n=1 Tax=Streptomyces sp. NPDC048057 TaxID=3155628 RepID=UPI0033D3B3E8